MTDTNTAAERERARFLGNLEQVFGRHGRAAAERMSFAELAELAQAFIAIAAAQPETTAPQK